MPGSGLIPARGNWESRWFETASAATFAKGSLVVPLRYDVRFFVAEAPQAQAVVHDGVELTEHLWLTPSKALEEYEQGKIGMVLPQIMTLVDISRFKTVEEAVTSAKTRRVPANLTKIKRINDDDVEVMPDGSVFERRPPVYSWPKKQ